MQSSMKIGVIGAIHLDRIAYADRPFQPDTSTPGKILPRAGGVGANIARAMARLGMSPVMHGCLGEDADGTFLIQSLGDCGIDTSCIKQVPGARTGSYLALHNPDGTLFCAISDSEITSQLTFSSIHPIPKSLLDCDIWLCETNLEEDALLSLAAQKAHRRLAADTVSIAKAPKLRALLPHLDILFTNIDEAHALLGLTENTLTPVELAEKIAEKGVNTVLVSNAGAPLALHHQGTTSSHQPFEVVPKDVTGAGDAFIAGFLFATCHNQPPVEAVQSGLGAAAITVEATGAAPETLSTKSLRARLMEQAQ